MRTKPYDIIRIPDYFVRMVLLLLAALLSLSSVAQKLEIHHLDVGQGDATLFVTRDKDDAISRTVLIDGGRYNSNGQAILDYLKEKHINKLDFVIASHYDADHTGGLIRVLEFALNDDALTVDSVYDRGTVLYPKPQKSPAYKQVANQYGTKHQAATPGWKVKLYDDENDAFDITMLCLAVNGQILLSSGATTNAVPAEMNTPDENDLSTAFVFKYGKFQYLTGGDIGGKNGQVAGTCDGPYGCKFLDIETQVVAVAGEVSAHKINHHGSRCSTNVNWANMPSAMVAFLSSGKHGTYKHPRQEVLTALDNSPALKKVYWTASVNYYNRTLSAKMVLNVPDNFAIVLSVNKTNKDSKNEDKTINEKVIFYVGDDKYEEPAPPASLAQSSAQD